MCVSSAYLVLGLERSHGRPVARFFLIMTTASIFHRVRARWFVSYLRGSKVDHLAHYYQEIAVCVEHAEIQCMALCSHFGSQCSQCLQTTRLRAIRAKSWTVRACRRRVDYNAVRERLKRGARSSQVLSANSSGAAEALRGCDFMPTAAATGPLRPTPSPRTKLDLLTNLLDREDDDRPDHHK